MSDVAEEIGRRQGGWYDYAKVNTIAGGHWIGVPQFIISWAITYREDWFKEHGVKYPETWDEFRAAGSVLKAKGKPFGQAFGHSINDPNNWCYPLVWMWGGMEVDKDGRTVALDTKAVVEAVKFNNVLWKEVFDEGGLGWDDSNNNRAFLSSDISLTGNAPSIYVAARKQAPDVYRGTSHGHFPAGPAGRFYWLPAWNSCVMKYSKNQQAAKDFIRFYMDRAQFDKYFETMDTFGIPGTKVYFDHALWTRDPKTTVFRETLQSARQVGYAGRRAARRPRRCRSSSSSTCSPGASRARHPRRRSSGPRRSCARSTGPDGGRAPGTVEVEVHLFANLADYGPPAHRGTARVELPEGASVRDLVRPAPHPGRGAAPPARERPRRRADRAPAPR